MWARLTRWWVYGGVLAGALLLALAPALAVDWSLAVTLVFLSLPVYMIHQYEEHDDDRFRVFFNEAIGGGREVLSPAAVFFINVPGVWGVNLVAFYLAWAVSPGLGLIAVYLILVNALVHIAHGVAFKRYNPGLGTAIALFLPFGGYCVHVLGQAGATLAEHLLGLGIAIAIHAGIVFYAKARGAFAEPLK